MRFQGTKWPTAQRHRGWVREVGVRLSWKEAALTPPSSWSDFISGKEIHFYLCLWVVPWTSSQLAGVYSFIFFPKHSALGIFGQTKQGHSQAHLDFPWCTLACLVFHKRALSFWSSCSYDRTAIPKQSSWTLTIYKICSRAAWTQAFPEVKEN